MSNNGFSVVVVDSPPPKVAPPPKPIENEPDNTEKIATPLAPTTFTVGVTDVTFNWINAIFGRSLKTTDGKIVTLAFWHQQETISTEDVPYFGDVVNR